MKKIINKYTVIALAAGLYSSCKPNLTAPDVSAGELDLTTYVAIGNSLTSGFQNGGLYYEGQKSSYANVLAKQFKLANPNLVFNTPYFDAAKGGVGQPEISISGSGINTVITVKVPAPMSLQEIYNACTNKTELTPAVNAPMGDAQALLGADSLEMQIINVLGGGGSIAGTNIYNTGNSTALKGPYQNMGVPGAKAIDINDQGFGGTNFIRSVDIANQTLLISNPYFSRFSKNQATSSILSDALDQNPTFVSLFIGNNDVLLWASSGGTESTLNSITDDTRFKDSINSMVTKLSAKGAKGIIVNISDVTGSAYFNFRQGNTSMWIMDETSTPRPWQPGDLLLLTTPWDSVTCYGMGSASLPIPGAYVLTANEVDQVKVATAGFNKSLEAAANTANWAFFDMNQFTLDNSKGVHYNGMELTSTFVTGGIFSLDGLHLTPRGYGLLANGMIATINAKYGSTIPGADITKLNGVTFPNK